MSAVALGLEMAFSVKRDEAQKAVRFQPTVDIANLAIHLHKRRVMRSTAEI